MDIDPILLIVIILIALIAFVIWSAYEADRLEDRLESLMITLIGTTFGVLLAFRADAFLQERQEANQYHAVLSQVTQELTNRRKLLRLGDELVLRPTDLDTLPGTLLPGRSVVPSSMQLLGRDPTFLEQASARYRAIISLLRWAAPDPGVPPEYRGDLVYGEYKQRRLSAWVSTALEATRLETRRLGGAISEEVAEDSIVQALNRYTDSLAAMHGEYEGEPGSQ